MNTTTSVIIEIEGFEDFRGEFGTGIIVAKPAMYVVDDSRIENVIEDFCIDVSLGSMPRDDPMMNQKAVLNTLYRLRKAKRTPTYRYFRVVVQVFIGDEQRVYEIIESDIA